MRNRSLPSSSSMQELDTFISLDPLPLDLMQPEPLDWINSNLAQFSNERPFHQAVHFCQWPECRTHEFSSSWKLSCHLQDTHRKVLLKTWTVNKKCQWPKCLSRAIFKSKSNYQTHLDNIHVNPLLCGVTGCTYQKPFRNNHDLTRHINTIHSKDRTFQYSCSHPQCISSQKKFVRKDKWLEHLRKSHNNQVCPFTHCERVEDVFGTPKDLTQHIKDSHGSYECGIGPCQDTVSRFAEFEFCKHLEYVHGICNPQDIGGARNIAYLAKDHTIRQEDFPTLALNPCYSCLVTINGLNKMDRSC